MELSGQFPTATEVEGLGGADLDLALVTIERVRREVEAAYVAVLDAADRSGRYRDDGHASVKGWAMALGRTSGVETHRRMQTMRALREMPTTRAALRGGRLGVDQVREMAKLHANPRARDVIVEAEADLLRHAERRSFDDFDDVARRWEAFADPVGAERSAERAHDERSARLFERDGVVHLNARCGVAQGAALLEIFDRQCEAEFLADWEGARAEHGSDAHSGHIERTAAQRGMDALQTIFERAASAPADAVAPLPVVNLVTTLPDFEERVAAAAAGRPPAPATAGDIDERRCETITGIQLTPADAVAAALIGYVRRVVVDSAGVVIDLGQRRRFTGGAREAVLLGGRRCSWPGCGRDSHRNQIDHTSEHSAGGPTRPSNGGVLCGRHNRWKSRRYVMHRDAEGVWHVSRPDGTELTEPAAA